MSAILRILVTVLLATFIHATPIVPQVLLGPEEPTLSCATRDSADYCTGTISTSEDGQHLCGDPRLGPLNITALGALVADYDPMAGLCPRKFLEQYAEIKMKDGKPEYRWRYPAKDGFQLDPWGNPITSPQVLPKGLKVDRFGSEKGRFISPASTPFTQRAIPPDSLNRLIGIEEQESVHGYYQYVVEKSFTVVSGPTGAAFGQPGQGTQYQLPVTVKALVDAGYLRRVPITLPTSKDPVY